MKRYICIQKCPELDCDNSKHCTNTEEGIQTKEEIRDYCPCGNTAMWVDLEIKGVETFHDKVSGSKRGKNTVYNFKIDGINICHCGDLGHILNSKQIEEIGSVDILLLPIGGLATINAFDATEVMKQLTPTIVIPMHYRTKALGLLGYVFGTVDKFISVSGLKAKEYDKLELNRTNMKDYSGIVVLKYN